VLRAGGAAGAAGIGGDAAVNAKQTIASLRALIAGMEERHAQCKAKPGASKACDEYRRKVACRRAERGD